MKLDVSNALSHPGQEYPFSGLQAIADQEIGGDTVRIDECAVEGTFLSDEDGNISVKGKLKTVAHAPCANCLEDAQAEIENEFDEVFQRNGDMEDNEIFAYTGHEVELDKLVMSYAWLCHTPSWLCRSAFSAERIVRALNTGTRKQFLPNRAFNIRSQDCSNCFKTMRRCESWLFRRGKSLRLASTAAAPTGSSHCRVSASAPSAVR